MASKKLLGLLCLGVTCAYTAQINNWSELSQGGIMEDTFGNFTYDEKQSKDFVLKDQIFFLNPDATLRITANISGTWNGNEPCGVVFCANGANGGNNAKVVFNKGNIIFDLKSLELNAPNAGYFGLNKASLDINSNLTINVDLKSKIGNGVFFIKDSMLNIEDANLVINVFDKTLLNAKGNSSITINRRGNTLGQSVRLTGNIEASDSSKIEMLLGNSQSFFSGTINLNNNASLDLTLINSRADIWGYKENGGKARSVSRKITAKASTLNASLEGASGTDISLTDGSTWKMWGNSQVKDLSLSQSSIDFLLQRFGTPLTPIKLEAHALSGQGNFILYADVATKTLDTTSFKKASGTHLMQVYYNPQTFTQALALGVTEADNMVVATISGTDSQAVFEGGVTEIGLLQYKTQLVKKQNMNQTQWLISHITPCGDSSIAIAISTVMTTPYRLFELSQTTLTTRLGDLRKYPKDYGLYFRYQIGLNHLNQTPNTLESEDFWMNFSGGFDMNRVYFNRVDFLGFGFDVMLLKTNNDLYRSNSQSYGANFYYSWIFHSRFYVDLIVKYAFAPSEFELFHQKVDFNSHLITLGTEIGQKFLLSKTKSAFYLKPQGKLTTGVILPADLALQDKMNETLTAKLQTQIPLIAHAGLFVGYECNEGFIGDLSVGTFIEYALNNGGEVILKDPRNRLKKKFSGDLDVGISAIGSIEIKDFLRMHFDLSSSFMGDYTSNIAFNAGIRWSFGDRYVPPPPPPADPNRYKVRFKYKNKQRTIPVIKKDEIENMKHHNIDRRMIERQYYRTSARDNQGNRNRNRF